MNTDAAIDPDTRADLLGPLVALLDEAGDAYRGYLDGGRTFAHAQRLRGINDRIAALLDAASTRLDAPLRRDAEALGHHLAVWSSQWDALAATLAPSATTPFVFETAVRFPTDAARRLREAAAAG